MVQTESTTLSKQQMAARLVQDIPNGAYVNLGIGLPTLVGHNLDPSKEIVIHSENGILGGGGPPEPGHEDPDFVNAGKAYVELLPGGSLFDSAASFGMMRSGALDIAVLGAFQVSARGDLANWRTNAIDAVPAVGGAMDLASGAKQVYVVMTLFDKSGNPKLLPECSFPLTAVNCVNRVYTDHAVFQIEATGVRLIETHGNTTSAYLQEQTGITFINN